MKLLLSVLLLAFTAAPVSAEPFQARYGTQRSGVKIAEGDGWYRKMQRQKANNAAFMKKNAEVFGKNSKTKKTLNKKIGKRNSDSLWSNLFD